MTTSEDGALNLVNLKRQDTGIYKCDIIDSTSDDQISKHKKIFLEVKSKSCVYFIIHYLCVSLGLIW